MAGVSSAKWGGICGLISGVLFIALFAVLSAVPSNVPADQILANFSTYRTSILAGSALLGVAFLFAIPFFVALRDALEKRDSWLVNVATTFIIIALAVLFTLTLLQYSLVQVLADVYATQTGARRDAALIAAQAVLTLGSSYNLGVVAVAGATGLYGLTMRGSKTFPDWVAYAGIVSAVAILLSLLLPGAGAVSTGLFVAFFIFFLIWYLGSAVFLWRAA